MARRATAIKQEHEKSQNLLILDAGSSLYGQPLANKTQGRVIVEAMNAMGYQAMALGDRDLMFGTSALAERMQEARFAFLSANLVWADSGQPVAKPYATATVNGRKIGLIGLTHPGALTTLEQLLGADKGKAVAATLRINDPVAAAKEYLLQVQKETNVVLLLTNLGIGLDQKLAKEVPGITAIIGGRSRVILQPLVRAPETGTVIAQAGFDGEFLGILELEIDGRGKVTAYEGKVLPLGPEYADDPAMNDLLKKFQD